MDIRSKKTVTIQSEVMRSNQEVEIANFLYLNNIDYEYEPLTEHKKKSEPFTYRLWVRISAVWCG